jgi:hypothetical protein
MNNGVCTGDFEFCKALPHIPHYGQEELIEQSVPNLRDEEEPGGIIFWLDAVFRVVVLEKSKHKIARNHESAGQSACNHGQSNVVNCMKLSKIDQHGQSNSSPCGM